VWNDIGYHPSENQKPGEPHNERGVLSQSQKYKKIFFMSNGAEVEG